MPYVYTLPESFSFQGEGFFGYSFGPMKQKDLEVLYVESEKGHDTFMVCRGVERTYYVLAGTGSFTIDGCEYNVQPGDLIEVPSKVEYSYSGRMTMLVFCRRRWLRRRDKWTRWNPDVVGMDDPWPLDAGSWLIKLIGIRIFGKSPTNAFLRVNHRVWKMFPSGFLSLRLVDWYGHLLHALAQIQGVRTQAYDTFFLRNRPELDLIRRLVGEGNVSDTVRVAVLGCSIGAEAYSIAWAIRTVRRDVKLVMRAVDISREAVEFARRGVYSLKAEAGGQEIHDHLARGLWRRSRPGSELVGAEIFERMTPVELNEFFDLDGDVASVKSWIKDGIDCQDGDVRASDILDAIGPQDLVVASNFLCHMEATEAERCLRNIARLVSPGGYLLVSGIDLDLRTKVASDLEWLPLQEMLDEIHEGDPSMRNAWPFHYGGLEPLNKRRADWRTRYAAVFQIGARATGSAALGEREPKEEWKQSVSVAASAL
jgi:chemotaxis methyl-accepting protein methylase/mannose-6-phosphate isomerase-like protein (cupin superfamily)